MPGLSRYNPARSLKPRNDDDPYLQGTDLDEYRMGNLEVPPEILTRMRQRLQAQQGFADPGRTAAETMFHGLAENVPSQELDRNWRVLNEFGRAGDSFSFRQLMDALKRISPQNSLETQ